MTAGGHSTTLSFSFNLEDEDLSWKPASQSPPAGASHSHSNENSPSHSQMTQLSQASLSHIPLSSLRVQEKSVPSEGSSQHPGFPTSPIVARSRATTSHTSGGSQASSIPPPLSQRDARRSFSSQLYPPDPAHRAAFEESGYTEVDLVALRPLLQTTTADTLQTAIFPIMDGHEYIVVGVASEDEYDGRLARFKLASRLVQDIKLDTSLGVYFQISSMLGSLRFATLADPLFPCLKSLDLRIMEAKQLDYIEYLMHPAVRSVRIVCENPEPAEIWNKRFAVIFKKIKRSWTERLQEPADLVLLRAPMITWRGKHLAYLTSLPALTKFRGDDSLFSPSLFRFICSSPRLMELSADILYSTLSGADLLTEPLKSSRFPRLKKLVLNASLVNIKTLLSYLGPSLEDLHLTTSCERMDFADLEEFIPNDARWATQKLESFHWTIEETDRDASNFVTYDEGLEDLWIRITAGLPQPRAPAAFPWKTLKPLLRCTGMTHFTFRFLSWNHLDLRDNDLREMSEAWPVLKTLVLEWEKRIVRGVDLAGLHDQASLTLRCLKDLAFNCRHLRTLKLSSLRPEEHVALPELRPKLDQPLDMYLGDAQWTNTPDEEDEEESHRVASYLFQLWPNMRLNVHPNNAHVVVWKRVMDKLLSIRWGF
ncbi:hypothetical protein CALVIDRAFT_599145 [Calocera viscosa TUFC12733]|uniref:Uncharacterized protein n=1 Tax=Calocera viscosa (strain TUFC12733) TaxID=1330018 RepID=A0A167L5F5_CALVF|nr:hypothetical protein CALVIDRAFT_599145 [Calocera viscosa TUFC12733]